MREINTQITSKKAELLVLNECIFLDVMVVDERYTYKKRRVNSGGMPLAAF